MMRSPSKWAVAVRKPDGEIAEVVRDIVSPMRKPLFRLPVIRAGVTLKRMSAKPIAIANAKMIAPRESSVCTSPSSPSSCAA